MHAIGHRFDEIEAELDALTDLRDKPAGTVRITCGDFVLESVLLPKLAPLLRAYPDIKLEFDVNYGFRDIVADRFDAGVRMGNTIDKDMIAVPIGPPLRMAVVASPEYFKEHPPPKAPQDLTAHRCINRSPAGVGDTLRVVRVSRRICSLSSSPRIAWLNADCVTPSTAAARVKLPSRPTVTNARRSSKFRRATGGPNNH